MSAEFRIIAAVDQNNVIGKDGELPWHYPGDLKYFKELTNGHSIVMGRKTWDSLPRKPLPNRANWVLSRSKSERERIRSKYPTVNTLGEFKTLQSLLAPKDVWWVIGGAEIYKEALLYAAVIELTIVPERTEGGNLVRFPELDRAVWHETASRAHPYCENLKCVRYERTLNRE